MGGRNPQYIQNRNGMETDLPNGKSVISGLYAVSKQAKTVCHIPVVPFLVF
jgi:hypothetical protein